MNPIPWSNTGNVPWEQFSFGHERDELIAILKSKNIYKIVELISSGNVSRTKILESILKHSYIREVISDNARIILLDFQQHLQNSPITNYNLGDSQTLHVKLTFTIWALEHSEKTFSIEFPLMSFLKTLYNFVNFNSHNNSAPFIHQQIEKSINSKILDLVNNLLLTILRYYRNQLNGTGFQELITNLIINIKSNIYYQVVLSHLISSVKDGSISYRFFDSTLPIILNLRNDLKGCRDLYNLIEDKKKQTFIVPSGSEIVTPSFKLCSVPLTNTFPLGQQYPRPTKPIAHPRLKPEEFIQQTHLQSTFENTFLSLDANDFNIQNILQNHVHLLLVEQNFTHLNKLFQEGKLFRKDNNFNNVINLDNFIRNMHNFPLIAQINNTTATTADHLDSSLRNHIMTNRQRILFFCWCMRFEMPGKIKLGFLHKLLIHLPFLDDVVMLVKNILEGHPSWLELFTKKKQEMLGIICTVAKFHNVLSDIIKLVKGGKLFRSDFSEHTIDQLSRQPSQNSYSHELFVLLNKTTNGSQPNIEELQRKLLAAITSSSTSSTTSFTPPLSETSPYEFSNSTSLVEKQFFKTLFEYFIKREYSKLNGCLYKNENLILNCAHARNKKNYEYFIKLSDSVNKITIENILQCNNKSTYDVTTYIENNSELISFLCWSTKILRNEKIIPDNFLLVCFKNLSLSYFGQALINAILLGTSGWDSLFYVIYSEISHLHKFMTLPNCEKFIPSIIKLINNSFIHPSRFTPLLRNELRNIDSEKYGLLLSILENLNPSANGFISFPRHIPTIPNSSIMVHTSILPLIEVSSNKLTLPSDIPVVKSLDIINLRPSSVKKLYVELAKGILQIWNHEAIQPNLRKLFGLSKGNKAIDLSLALNSRGELDLEGIRCILKPFYDFLINQKNTPLMALTIVKDAIFSLGLECAEEDVENLKGLFSNLTEEINFFPFLLNAKGQRDRLKGFQLQMGIPLLEFDSSLLDLNSTVRDLLFFFSLQELQLRANNSDKIPQNHVGQSYQQIPALLIFTKNDKTVCYLLTVIKNVFTHSIMGIGYDNKEKNAALILQQIAAQNNGEDAVCIPLTPEELNLLQIEYKKSNPPSFYLFSPIPTNAFATHRDNSVLDTVPEPISLQMKHIKRKKSSNETPEPKHAKSTAVESNLKINIDLTLSPSDSSLQSGSQQNSRTIGLAQNNLIISDSAANLTNRKRMTLELSQDEISVEEENPNHGTNIAKHAKKSNSLAPYQELDLEIISNSNQTVTKSDKKKSDENSFKKTSIQRLVSEIPKSIIASGNPIENLILFQLCGFAVNRIEEIVHLSNLRSNKALDDSTKEIWNKLSQPANVEITFDDIQLKSYQKEGVRFLLESSKKGLGCILAFAPGLGKTMVACEAIRQLQKNDTEGRPALVLVPNSLLIQWLKYLIERQFSSRLKYYSETFANFSNLTKPQQNFVIQCYSKFVISSWKKKEELQNTLIAQQRKVASRVSVNQEAITQNLKEELVVIQNHIDLSHEITKKIVCSPDPMIGANILINFTTNKHLGLTRQTQELWDTKILELIRLFQQTHLSKIEELKKSIDCLSHRCFRQIVLSITKSDINNVSNQLHKLFKAIEPFPIILEQIRKFLTSQSKYNLPIRLESVILDNSLLLPNLYEQILGYTTDNKSYIPENNFNIVVTTHSTLYALSHDVLLEFQKKPWISLTIDEAHEWSTNISDPKDIESKVQSKFLKNFIEDIDSRSAKFLLTGTPQVNHPSNTISLLQLANPKENFSRLALLLKNRKALLDKALLVAFQEVNENEEINPQSLQNVKSRFGDFLLAFEHTRQLFLKFIMVYTPDDKNVKEDWTVDGVVYLPSSEAITLKSSLTDKQKQAYIDIKSGNLMNGREGNMLELDVYISSLQFHPILVREWKNKTSKEITTEMKTWSHEQYNQFIGDSALLIHFFNNSDFEELIKKREPMLIFLNQLKFCKILKKLFDHYYPAQNQNIQAKLYNGKKKRDVKLNNVKEFESPNSNTKILILTPKAGGVGLNLPSAKHVFEIAPWWNDSTSKQMQARALRAGLNTFTKIVKFYFGTVEELHKSLTAGTKDKWQTVYFSKDNLKKIIFEVIEALSSDFLNISLQASGTSIAQYNFTKNKEKIKNIYNSIVEEVLQSIRESLDQSDKFHNNSYETSENLDSSNVTSRLTALSSVFSPRFLEMNNNIFQVIPLNVSNQEDAQIFAYKLSKQKSSKIENLLSFFHNLSDENWNRLIDTPLAYYESQKNDPTFAIFYQPLNNSGRESLIRWFTLDDENCLQFTNPGQIEVSGTPRILQLSNNRFAILIKLDKLQKRT